MHDDMPFKPDEVGIIIVDHGSRRVESNLMLEAFVERFRENCGYKVIEAAHMELAEPSIGTAFDRCIQQGVRKVVVIPYFLLPGKHWDKDIPELTTEAARRHPGVQFLVGAPIGLHPMMTQVIQARLSHCLNHAAGKAPECESCEGTHRCTLRGVPEAGGH